MKDLGLKTVYGLKDAYEERHPNGHFFDSETLKFFGERLSEMRLLKTKKKIKDVSGDEHLCYVLSSVQRVNLCGSMSRRRVYHYFDTSTLDQVIV